MNTFHVHLIILLMAFFACSQTDNYSLTRKYISGEITIDVLLTNLDTSAVALQNFIDVSVAQNMIDSGLKITKGPVEFIALVDSLLEQFGKSGKSVYLTFLGTIRHFADGYIAEEFAASLARACDNYPLQFKKAAISQGEMSWILTDYLYIYGSNWKNGLFFRHQSELDIKLANWMEKLIEIK